MLPHKSTNSKWRIGRPDVSAHRIISDISGFVGDYDPSAHRAIAAGDLRSKASAFKGLRCSKDYNYDVLSQATRERLFQNMYNTEIDIVLETPKTLLIGEAKHEESLGADSKRILVHQLIRQYVMAKVLLTTIGCNKNVIPFIVGDCVDKIIKTRQVQFMIAEKWMNGCNVLDWNEVGSLASLKES